MAKPRKPTTRRTSPGTLELLGGMGAGAALMYFLDPDRGVRRRHLLRDQVVHAGRVATHGILTTSRDLRNRGRGLAATAASRFRRDGADDWVIAERVRSVLGRVVSHPRAILVSVQDGQVTLAGPILQEEVPRLLAAARRVRGVREVENRLEVHESAEHVPALQGGVRRKGMVSEFRQERWTPAARLFTTAAGGALALFAARRRSGAWPALGVAGLALATRGATNLSTQRLTGIRAGKRAVDVQKAITVSAPVEEVFAFFSHWENWPSWMKHVREVTRTGTVGGQARTHWVVDGPAGVPISWDAVVTEMVPNEVIGWRSVEGSVVQHEGRIRFLETDDGATTVQVRMCYNPPAGAVGHAVAAFFGRDPRQQMNDDLARMKTLIETGRPPHDAARPEPDVATRAAAAASSESREAGA